MRWHRAEETICHGKSPVTDGIGRINVMVERNRSKKVIVAGHRFKNVLILSIKR